MIGEMNINGPLVSIIIPAYNAERYIKRAIESVLNQAYKNIEIIVIDDGSTDKTAEIIKSFKDPRIIYLWQKNQGQGVARNYGIKKSKGKYITFLDADDYYFPEKVEKEVDFLENHPQFKVVYCNALHFYSKNHKKIFKKKAKYHSGDIFPDLLQSSFINPNTLMINRGVLEKAGGFNESKYYPEDWEMVLKISLAGFRFGYLDEDLVEVEIRENSNTTIDIQPILKRNCLIMFEKIFSQMSQEKKDFYKVEKILQNLKFKLAIAYLTNGQKKKFIESFIDLYNYPLIFFRYLIGGILFIFPSPLLKVFLRKLWEINQRRSWQIAKKQYGK